MVADVGRIVTSAAGSRKRRNAAGNEAAGGCLVVYSSDPGDVDRLGIENHLPARNGGSRVRVWQPGPGIEDVEDRRTEPTVARRREPARLFEVRDQRVHA